MSDDVALLVPFSEYEENAVNIGTQQKSADMARFIQTVRDDGLYLLDVASTDQRIRLVAQFLCRYEPGRVMVVSARQYGQRPARLFAEAIGANASVGRFIPGSLTNPALRSYVEPDMLFVTDPAADQQALIFIITHLLSLDRSPVSGDADRLFPGNPLKYPFQGLFNIFRDKFRNLHRRFFSNGGVHTAIPDLAATILGFSMPSGTAAGCLTSAQRPGCGKILPGFNSSPGLKNSLTRIMFSRSSLL